MLARILAVLLTAVAITSSWAQTDDNQPIAIHPRPINQNTGPRSPIFNPFTAQLWDNYVVLYSNESCGDVAVTLTSTAGDFFTTNFDTEDGSIIIPISGNNGYYVLTLVTGGSLIFDGEFYL